MQDHQSTQGEEVSDDIMWDEGVDIYDEEINDTLLKGVISIEKYRLMVELGHIES